MTSIDDLEKRMANLEQYTRRELYELALEMRTVVGLYRKQIRYLIAELERIGWTPDPPEAQR